MPTSLETAVEYYVRSRGLKPATSDEYRSTLRKWNRWGGGVPIEKLARREIREFLDCVFVDPVEGEPSGGHVVGVGAGHAGITASIPKAASTAGRCWSALPYEG